MKTLACIIVVVVMMVMASSVQGGDSQELAAYYERIIAEEIQDCRRQSELRSSRSPNLRMKGHREASKALFLETHREQLVDSMLALGLNPKTYKVHRYLNDRFSCTCYAGWDRLGNP